MVSRMERKKEKNKKIMLDATEKLIAEKGITHLTMEKVAQEADVQPALYISTSIIRRVCLLQ